MWFVIICLFAGLALPVLCAAIISTKYDRTEDDRQQEEYLRERNDSKKLPSDKT